MSHRLGVFVLALLFLCFAVVNAASSAHEERRAPGRFASRLHNARHHPFARYNEDPKRSDELLRRLPHHADQVSHDVVVDKAQLLCSNTRGGVTVTKLWHQSTHYVFFTGVALLSNGQYATYACGDWYTAPYPFAVAANFYDSPYPIWHSNSAPGLITRAPLESASQALFTAINFTSFQPVVSLYSPAISSTPTFTHVAQTSSDNAWQTGMSSAVSANATTLAFAYTVVPSLYNLQVKHAVFTTMSVPSGAVAMNYSMPNATGLERIFMSADTRIKAVVAAWQPTGNINTSLVTIYDGSTLISRVNSTYIYGGCVSPGGNYLVLSTSFPIGANRILVYGRARPSAALSLLVNVTLPYNLFPSTIYDTWLQLCRVTDSGLLMATFPLFWYFDYNNQTAVVSFQISPLASPVLSVKWVWLSTPVEPTLQDVPVDDALLDDGSVYVYTSWGGQAMNSSSSSSASSSAKPACGSTYAHAPTVHMFATAQANPQSVTPLVEFATQGSATGVDMVRLSGTTNTLLLQVSGYAAHMNVGSNYGEQYMYTCATSDEAD